MVKTGSVNDYYDTQESGLKDVCAGYKDMETGIIHFTLKRIFLYAFIPCNVEVSVFPKETWAFFQCQYAVDIVP